MIFFNKLKFRRVAIAIVVYSIIVFLLLSFDAYLNRYYRNLYSAAYTTIEYLCFAFVIAEIIKYKKVKLLILSLSLLFIVYETFNLFKIHFRTIDSIPIGIETILILLYTFYLFYEQFQKIETIYIYNNYWFWFIVGIIFYLSSSFFFNILADTNNMKFQQYWFLTYIFETVKNLCFVVGLIFLSKAKFDKQKPSPIPYLDVI